MRKQFSFSRIPLAAAVMLTLFSACKKEKIDLTDPVPTILGITVSPATVVEFQISQHRGRSTVIVAAHKEIRRII